MGSNSSTIRDSRASVSTGTPPPLVFTPNNYQELVITDGNALEEKKSPANYVRAPPSKGLKSSRIMAFHSKASWFGYFEATKALANLVVVSFTNGWYEPCRHMEPIFNALAAKYTNVEFVKIDVDELFEITRQHGIRIAPTFLFIKKGKEIDKVAGAGKEELERKIEKHRA